MTYNARLDVDNSELLLRPGMTATVAVVTREADDVLMVPARSFPLQPAPHDGEPRLQPARPVHAAHGTARRAPARRGGAEAGTRTLYVLQDGAPQAVQVKTGATDGENIEIVSGLGLKATRSSPASGRPRG